MTALKYDLYGGMSSLTLSLSNSSTTSQGFTPGATGFYTIARTSSDTYVLAGGVTATHEGTSLRSTCSASA